MSDPTGRSYPKKKKKACYSERGQGTNGGSKLELSFYTTREIGLRCLLLRDTGLSD